MSYFMKVNWHILQYILGVSHIYLLFSVKTQISQPPVDTRVILGRVASLQCKVSHADTVAFAVHWLHNNNPLREEGNHRVSVRRDGTLEIQEVRAADVGTYTCVVSCYVCALNDEFIVFYSVAVNNYCILIE